ncbi:MAG: DinB family protein [Chloroflexota bacterium]
MDETLALILRRLTTEGEKTAAFFEALGPDDWDQQVYTTGSRWRARHILAHFVSAERAYGRTLCQVLAGESGLPRDFDLDAFNEAEVASLIALDTPSLLAAFRQARAETVDLVSSLDSDDLAQRGYHPWFGDSALEDMLKLIYRHNAIHQRDVRRALDTRRPVEHQEIEPPSRSERT